MVTSAAPEISTTRWVSQTLKPDSGCRARGLDVGDRNPQVCFRDVSGVLQCMFETVWSELMSESLLSSVSHNRLRSATCLFRICVSVFDTALLWPHYRGEPRFCLVSPRLIYDICRQQKGSWCIRGGCSHAYTDLPSHFDRSSGRSRPGASTLTPMFRRLSARCIRAWTASHTHRTYAFATAFTGSVAGLGIGLGKSPIFVHVRSSQT